MDVIGQVIIQIFLLAMLAVGIYHAKRTTLDSYVTESNKVSSFSLVGTLVGTSFGGGVIVGMVTMGYEAGVVGHLVGLSYLIGFIVLALLAKPIRTALARSQGGTLLDVIQDTMGPKIARMALPRNSGHIERIGLCSYLEVFRCLQDQIDGSTTGSSSWKQCG